MNNIINEFRRQYVHLERFGLIVDNDILEIEGVKFISMTHPFIFDNRWIPPKFEGFFTRSSINSSDLPIEFQIDQSKWDWYKHSYLWAPERFEKFVSRFEKEIRIALDNSNLSKEEMLDALCFGDFKKHKNLTDERIRAGELPAYFE